MEQGAMDTARKVMKDWVHYVGRHAHRFLPGPEPEPEPEHEQKQEQNPALPSTTDAGHHDALRSSEVDLNRDLVRVASTLSEESREPKNEEGHPVLYQDLLYTSLDRAEGASRGDSYLDKKVQSAALIVRKREGRVARSLSELKAHRRWHPISTSNSNPNLANGRKNAAIVNAVVNSELKVTVNDLNRTRPLTRPLTMLSSPDTIPMEGPKSRSSQVFSNHQTDIAELHRELLRSFTTTRGPARTMNKISTPSCHVKVPTGSSRDASPTQI